MFGATGLAAALYAMFYQSALAPARLVILLVLAALTARAKVTLYRETSLSFLTSVVLLYHNGLYDFRFMYKRRDGKRTEILARLLRAFGTVALALSIFYFVSPELSIGRGALQIAGPLVLLLTLGWRWIIAARSPQLRF